jgi:predicted  nucleic acid-binding Zn-ribbon protein
MGKRKTHEEYVAEVAAKNLNIEVVERYIDAKTKILHRCKIDGHEWNPSPDSVLSGRGCPKCRGRYISRIMSRTHSEYINEVAHINSNIEVVGIYIDSGTKILHKCKIDGYIWNVVPSSILKGVGCPMCAGKAPYTTESFIATMSLVHPSIEVIGNYVNNKTNIALRCKIDGHEWNPIPHNVLRGQGCPKCGGRIPMSHDEYVNAVSQINKDLDVLGTFVNKSISILHRCKKDGHEWDVRPEHILNGHGCPVCNSSIGERLVANYLTDNNILYKSQHKFERCKNKRRLPFDFYLPNLNICIEYDGIQHFQPVEAFGGQATFDECQKNDAIKNRFCEVSQITLLRIRYDQDVNQVLDDFFKTIQND